MDSGHMGSNGLPGAMDDLDLLLVQVGRTCQLAQQAIEHGINVDDEIVHLYESADLLGRLAERTTDAVIAARVAHVGERVRAIATIIELEAAL
jgi:hypothetical protein